MPIHIELSEDVTFLNKAGIKRTLGELPDGAHVVIDARRTLDLEPDVQEILDDFMHNASERAIRCELIGFETDGSKKLKPAELERQVRAVAKRLGRKK